MHHNHSIPLAELRFRARMTGHGPLHVHPLGHGHIHETWLVEQEDERLVVQEINQKVFEDLKQLFDNARYVETHLRNLAKTKQYPLDVLTHRPDPDGRFAWFDEEGRLWRVYEFIAGTTSIDHVMKKAQALDAAWGFGTFAAAFVDVDPADIAEPIPGFHDLSARFEAFEKACQENPVDRFKKAEREIEFCMTQHAFVQEVQQLKAELPVRIGHNDTKVSNILLNVTTGDAKAVVDLDTVGPGYPMIDFGDMVRSFCSPVPEDETRLDHVGIRELIFDATAEGYLAAMGSHLNKLERYSLFVGAKMMCFMLSLRFLADYLTGDHYFGASTRRPHHNLERAQNQLKLYQELVKHQDALQKRFV